MKALTFKKSALAAALLAVAGTASAATTIKVGELNNDFAPTTGATDATNQNSFSSVTAGYGLVPSQLLLADNQQVVADTDDVVIAVQSGTTALSDGDLITYTFKNGGLDASKSYKLAMADDTVNFVIQDLASTVFSATTSNGVVSEITFRIDNAAGAETDAGDIFYLVASDFADDNTTAVNLAFDSGAGVTILAAEDATAGSAISVSAKIDYVSALATDVNTETVNVARVYDGINFTKASGVVGRVNFANDALTFVSGDTLTSGAFAISAVVTTDDDLGSNVDWNNDGEVTAADATYAVTVARSPIADQVVTPGSISADVTVTGTHCDAVKSLSVGGTAIKVDADTACTWESSISNGDEIELVVDGETTLTGNAFSAAYEIKYGTATAAESSNTVFTWETNVQANGTAKFPYLLAYNNNNAAFSFVKIDNTANTKPLVLAMMGTVEAPLVEDMDQVSFQNYYLMTVPAGEIGQFTGDEIIAALVDAKGAAADGYNDTDLDLDVTNLYNMSVTLQAVSASTNASMTNVKFSGVNTSANGRTNVTQ